MHIVCTVINNNGKRFLGERYSETMQELPTEIYASILL